ncbi:TerD family protein [Nocardia sp. NPDC049707]|uniref:TerD family protein n=1 Tax=Nocardia sp. NPDC049707 TaxID=3154735 RepID=UPI00341C2D14
MLFSLRDDTEAALEHVSMGLGWDPARPRRWFSTRVTDIDLNAAALLFAGANIVDVVYHAQLTSQDGSVRHLGDSVTGEGDGDNEVIVVDLTRLPSQVTTIFFIVTSYTGQTFDEIRNAFCRLVDSASGTEIARYELTGSRSHTGLVMGKVFRTDGGWHFETIGDGIQARHPVEAVHQLSAYTHHNGRS